MSKEQIMNSDRPFEGKLICVRVDTVELPGQRYAKREIVEHKGSVAIIAFTEDNELLLVKQYRLAVGKSLLELPAGIINPGEGPKDAAFRELKEETGYEAGKIKFVTEIYTSPGFTDERIHLFYAKNLNSGQQDLDDLEDIEIVKMPLEEAVRLVKLGEITDAKTIIGVLNAQELRASKGGKNGKKSN